ncbi:MAG: hypothetical protein M3R15_28250, partial [Acidobacteriota bacterium]|nr:hypothetical protein [Acidobacteriota bacterium]
MEPRNFLAELKRRNVYKVAVAYAVAGWLLVQIASLRASLAFAQETAPESVGVAETERVIVTGSNIPT